VTKDANGNDVSGKTTGCYSFCRNMIVDLPPGPQITDIHYSFAALPPRWSTGAWYETQPNVDLMWAMILPAT
jgi:hypothetical protein